ncbi:MAG: tetratricopeptide repeat protein [Planctomycetota bacterium]
MSDRLPQLEKLHAADPHDADVTYMLALEHAKGEGPDAAAQALRWLDRTLALDPGYHYAYFQKAKLLDAQGDPEAAHATLDAGLARAQADGNTKAFGELEDLKVSLL